MAGARGRGRADSRCPACGAPLLVQWVGDTAALQARVALPPPDEPRPYGPAAAASGSVAYAGPTTTTSSAPAIASATSDPA